MRSTAVAVGLLLATTGTAVAWSATPAAASGAAGFAYGWGANDWAQVNGTINLPLLTAPAAVPGGAADVIQVASASAGGVALHADGSVWAWGYGAYLGDGSTTTHVVPERVMGLPKIVQIATGYTHVLAVDDQQRVWAWGTSTNGETGPNHTTDGHPVLVPLTGVAQVSAGYHFSVALRANGEVWTWGNNAEGELGRGSALTGQIDPTPKRAALPYGITQVVAGHFHALALRGDGGSVWGWGENYEGQLGTGSIGGYTPTPMVVDKHMPPAVKIAAGLEHSMAVDAAGNLWVWGSNHSGQVGDGTTQSRATPYKVALRAPAVLFDGGRSNSSAVLSDGSMWTWGGQIGDWSRQLPHTVRPTLVPGVSGVSQIAIDAETMLVLETSQMAVVPDLSYSDVASAGLSLSTAGLTLGTVTPLNILCNFAGEIIDQSPLPGALVPVGTAVSVSYVDPTTCF